MENIHCVKYVQIRSFFCTVFSRIWTEYGPEKTLYLDTFHSVIFIGRFEVSKEIQAKISFRLITSCAIYSGLTLVSAYALDIHCNLYYTICSTF